MTMGLVEANPTIGSAKPAESKPRERVLSDDELAAIWMDLVIKEGLGSIASKTRPRAATAHSFRMRFWATKYSFRANCQPGSDCRLFELGRISQEATERLSTCWPF
jgi:hypothetical protein